MNWSPMLIVWIILAGVVICVIAAIIKSKSYVSTTLIFIGPAMIFSTSFLGYFVTGFSSPTPETWWQALLVRTVWQLGGAILLAAVFLYMNRSDLRGLISMNFSDLQEVLKGSGIFGLLWCFGICGVAPAFIAIGVAMSFNPLRDLIEGPLLLRGSVDFKTEKIHRNTRGGDAIWANLRLTAVDGSQNEIDMIGWGATEAEDKLKQCEIGSNAEVLVLRHVERVLDARCN